MRRNGIGGALALALALGACGGGDHVRIDLPGGERTLDLRFPANEAVRHTLPLRVRGGLAPFETRLEDCPEWVRLFPDQNVLAGTGPIEAAGRVMLCTYVVTEREPGFRPARHTSYGLRLMVTAPRAGEGALKIEWDAGDGVRTLEFAPGEAIAHALEGPGGFTVSGGVPPYTRTLEGCPPWVTLTIVGPPQEATAGGVAPVEEIGTSSFCNYVVTESDPGQRPARSIARALEIKVRTRQEGTWRFSTRTTEGSEHNLDPDLSTAQVIAVLPHALEGSGTDSYTLSVRAPLSFDAATRVLSYTQEGADPLLDTATTYVYEVFGDDTASADDGLCIDIVYLDKKPDPPDDVLDGVRIRVRDDARRTENGRYECPDREESPGGSAARSNAVHEALGPVHARRASTRAHEAVRDAVRAWTAEGGVHATPSVSSTRLSGESAMVRYSGTSHWAGMAAHAGSDAWQAGVVAGISSTDLEYRAGEGLRARGYERGRHETEITGVHPFVAWHWSEDGSAWASLGVGTGTLRHRDDLGFRRWSTSTLAMRAWALGASRALARIGPGALEAQSSIEGFALNIEGGGQISRSIPTLRGRDTRAGLRWNADAGERWRPEVALAYRHERARGESAGRVEGRVGLRLQGLGHPRLSARLGVEGARAVDGGDAGHWAVSGALHLAPEGETHGVDAQLSHARDGGARAGEGVRAEVGYRTGRARPYARLESGGAGAARRALGVALATRGRGELRAEIVRGSEDAVRVVLRLAL